MMIKELIRNFSFSFFSFFIPNNRMSFGFHRAEVIGALLSVFMIWVVTAFLVYFAIMRTVEQEFEVDSTIMLISSGIGIAVNIV